MNPTVGRIVHYETFGTPGGEFKPNPVAAIVTSVHSDDLVDLCVFYENGISFKPEVFRADAPTSGRWNWPPR